MKSKLIYGFLFLASMMMMSCADVSHVHGCLDPNEHTYGFWGGTWHGMIMTFSFVGELFSDDIAIYAVNNNGIWYDFGFIGGFFIMLKLFGVFLNGLLGK